MPGSIVHLTAAERRAFKEQEMRERVAVKAKKQWESKTVRGRKIREKRKRLEDAIQPDNPPLALAEMYGPVNTSLPAKIRPDEVPYDHTVPFDIKLDPFIEEIVTQPGFKDTIESIKDERAARFLKLIGQAQNRSMTWCAKAVGLTNSELAKIWCDSNTRQAFFRIVKRFPQVADKVVDDALGTQRSCPRCDGLGRIDVPERFREFFADNLTAICPNCEGRCTVPTASMPHAVERIWERMGWSKKNQGISVNVNMNDHSVDATISEMDGIEGDILEHRA